MDAELEKAYRAIFYEGVPETPSQRDHSRMELLEDIATGRTEINGGRVGINYALEQIERTFPMGQAAKKIRTIKSMNDWYNRPNEDTKKMALEIATEEGIESLTKFFLESIDTLKIYKIADLKRDFDRVLKIAEGINKEEDRAEIVLLEAREIAKSACHEAIDYMITKMPAYAKNYELGPGDKITMKEIAKKEEYAAA